METCPYHVNCSTSGDRKTRFASVTICFFGIFPRRCISWIVIGFVETFWFWALTLWWLPLLVGNHLGCVVAQTCIPYVLCIPRLSSSAQGICARILWGLTSQTPHFRLSIDGGWSGILLLVLHQYFVVWLSGNPQKLPRRCLLPPPFCLVLLVVSTAVYYHGTTRLICWRGISKLDW